MNRRDFFKKATTMAAGATALAVLPLSADTPTPQASKQPGVSTDGKHKVYFRDTLPDHPLTPIWGFAGSDGVRVEAFGDLLTGDVLVGRGITLDPRNEVWYRYRDFNILGLAATEALFHGTIHHRGIPCHHMPDDDMYVQPVLMGREDGNLHAAHTIREINYQTREVRHYRIAFDPSFYGPQRGAFVRMRTRQDAPRLFSPRETPNSIAVFPFGSTDPFGYRVTEASNRIICLRPDSIDSLTNVVERRIKTTPLYHVKYPTT